MKNKERRKIIKRYNKEHVSLDQMIDNKKEPIAIINIISDAGCLDICDGIHVRHGELDNRLLYEYPLVTNGAFSRHNSYQTSISINSVRYYTDFNPRRNNLNKYNRKHFYFR